MLAIWYTSSCNGSVVRKNPGDHSSTIHSLSRCPLTHNGLNPFILTQTQTNMLSNTAALLLSSEWPTLGQNLTQSLFYSQVWIISWYLLVIVSNMTNRMAIQILVHTSVEQKTHTKDHLSLKRSHGKIKTLPQHTQSRKKGRRTICLHLVLLHFCHWAWTGQSASIKVNTAPPLRLSTLYLSILSIYPLRLKQHLPYETLTELSLLLQSL